MAADLFNTDMYEAYNPLNRATKRAQLNDALLSAQGKQQEMAAKQAIPGIIQRSMGENGEVDMTRLVANGLVDPDASPYIMELMHDALANNQIQASTMKDRLDIDAKDYEARAAVFGPLAAKKDLTYGDWVSGAGEYYGKMAPIIGSDRARDNIVQLLASIKDLNPQHMRQAANQLNLHAMGAKDRLQALAGDVSWQNTTGPDGQQIRQPFATSAVTGESNPIGEGIPSGGTDTDDRTRRAAMISKTLQAEGHPKEWSDHQGELVASGRIAVVNDPYGNIISLYDMVTHQTIPIQTPGVDNVGGGAPSDIPGGPTGAVPIPDAGGGGEVFRSPSMRLAPGQEGATSAPAAAEGTNPAGAFGLSGSIYTMMNNIGDFVLGKLASPDVAKTENELETLMLDTKAAIRNSNGGNRLARVEQDLNDRVVNPADLSKEGPQRAKIKLEGLKGMIDARIVDIIEQDQMRAGLDPKTVAAARAQLPELRRLSRQYSAILARFDTGDKAPGPSLEEEADKLGLGNGAQ